MRLRLICLMGLSVFVSATAVAGEKFLADRHVERGVNCQSCHGQSAPAKVPMQTCLGCHGGSYAKLASRTEDRDMNFHASHIDEVNCSECHQGHRQSQLVCNQCHEFKVKVP